MTISNIAAWWKWFNGSDKPTVEPASTFLAEDALATGWRPLVFGDAAPQPPAEQGAELSDSEIMAVMLRWAAGGTDSDGIAELRALFTADRKARGAQP